MNFSHPNTQKLYNNPNTWRISIGPMTMLTICSSVGMSTQAYFADNSSSPIGTKKKIYVLDLSNNNSNKVVEYIPEK